MTRIPDPGLLICSIAIIAVTGTAVALETARMRLPPDFAPVAERIPAKGFGGANRGRYTAAELRGEFVRIETRFAAFDPLYVSNRGKSSFTLEGPGIAQPISGECKFKERVVTAGVVTFDAKKFAYVCTIEDHDTGGAASLTLQEAKASTFKEQLLARAERSGSAEVRGMSIQIASVHDYENSRLSSQTPVGYLLSLDGDVIGALELTDVNPVLMLRKDLDAQARTATLVAELALAVLRDPADSTLGD